MLTCREALTRAADQLSAHPETRTAALADAVLLLLHLLGVERAALVAHPERKLEREQLARYQEMVERRLRFEPVQYITGSVEFYGLTLAVGPGVLIPRPETELLVEAVLARVGPRARILDVGTGSGAIAIALAAHLPEATVIAVDLSVDALRIARGNAEKNKVQIEFVESDLLAGVEGAFDAIVSNPPYIAMGEREMLAAQVREWEPAGALFAGTSGLEIYQRLAPEAAGRLVAGRVACARSGVCPGGCCARADGRVERGDGSAGFAGDRASGTGVQTRRWPHRVSGFYEEPGTSYRPAYQSYPSLVQ